MRQKAGNAVPSKAAGVMAVRPCYTAWHRARVIAEYRRTGSTDKAAAAAHVGITWAYKVVKAAGLCRSCPVYSARMLSEARRLYVEERLSCRAVAARLAENYSPAPSQQWVFDHLRRRGVLRSKSLTNQIWMGRANGRDYESDLPRKARFLSREKRWSPARIARALGISRNAVRRYVAPEDRCDRAAARHREAWEADTPSARARREKRLRVLELRVLGARLADIKRETGLSIATICKYLREDDLLLRRRRSFSAELV